MLKVKIFPVKRQSPREPEHRLRNMKTRQTIQLSAISKKLLLSQARCSNRSPPYLLPNYISVMLVKYFDNFSLVG